MRREVPAVQAASSRRAIRASPGPTDGGSRHGQKCWAPFGPTAVDRRPSNSRGEAGRLKRDVHRGRGGANLTNTARGTPWVGRTCGYTDFDKPRCREASRPAGPFRTLGVPRALGTFSRVGGRNGNTTYPASQRIRAMTRVCFNPHPEEPRAARRHRKSVKADLRIQIPISGKPEIGG